MADISCPCCNVLLERRANPKGGFFLGCPRFFTTGCKVSYSPTEHRWCGVPFQVARASKRRSPVLSEREKIVCALVARLGYPREEVEEFVTSVGLFEAQKLVA